ncbi:DUF5682 family protein [Allorhizocola rhizosphaerae]|uniref:DUF5682 family protein n=1 Tax=Allorhizocola rhizosphaerae TaxID=1872709 RepID=UPI000E3CE2D3|nr:DUF5682 family protein [Allorhizocola rhizosphaerae]
MQLRVFGIRHHGPGSARALVRALDELKPDVILVEGPPEADGLVALAGSPQMRPPVALLAYTEKSSSFWPFAVFSPEWQAIRYSLREGVPLRFCDLPAGQRVTGQSKEDGIDPIASLADAAGYDDPERWWEDVIEHQRDGTPPFEAVAEAMVVVRASHPAKHYDLVREAYMRQVLRKAIKEGFERIAVVCGAWHAPALIGPLPSAASDAALLKGLAKQQVSMTWVPWTHGRLAWWTGYGAGVASPGWYHHLFTVHDRVIERWLVGVAGVLREDDLPVSSAHVIEATRLAEALAVLRGRPHAGLSEVTEATRAVLCDGDETRLKLVQRKVVVGEQLGTVPDETPSVPLVRDVEAAQRRLRFPPQAVGRDVNLDLRKPNDLARSQLLHRLRLLGIGWGTPQEHQGGRGTFWESWHVLWQPEFAVDLIVASAYGTSVEAAATAKVIEVSGSGDLPALTELVESCLLAQLPEAQETVLRALDQRAALDADIVHLMAAIPPLARTLRYGDVRRTDLADLAPVLTGLVQRVQIGLPGALTGVAEEAAKELAGVLDRVHESIRLLADLLPLRDEWLQALRGLVDRPDLPGLLAGRLTRLLRDEGGLTFDEVELRLARVLSIGVPPAQAAAFVEGFLSGGGLLLVHDEKLLSLIDRWVSALPAESFSATLPLLRRTFSEFAGPERRAIGERLRQPGARRPQATEDLDFDRVSLILPTLKVLLDVR